MKIRHQSLNGGDQEEQENEIRDELLAEGGNLLADIHCETLLSALSSSCFLPIRHTTAHSIFVRESLKHLLQSPDADRSTQKNEKEPEALLVFFLVYGAVRLGSVSCVGFLGFLDGG